MRACCSCCAAAMARGRLRAADCRHGRGHQAGRRRCAARRRPRLAAATAGSWAEAQQLTVANLVRSLEYVRACCRLPIMLDRPRSLSTRHGSVTGSGAGPGGDVGPPSAIPSSDQLAPHIPHASTVLHASVSPIAGAGTGLLQPLQSSAVSGWCIDHRSPASGCYGRLRARPGSAVATASSSGSHGAAL